MNWVNLRYRDFYDLPRIFITSYEGRQYLFDCPFDDELDDYPASYRVYQLPLLSEAELLGSWEQLSARATEFLGTVPVVAVQFDPTKRASINTAAFSLLSRQPELLAA